MQFRGGGKAHGPRPRSHAHDLTKKVRVLGLKLALSAKAQSQDLLIISDATSAEVEVFTLMGGRRSLAASGIGGIPETQEMLDYCAEHGITSDIELIDIASINEAYARMLKSDVRYRFVIDMASLT